MLSFEICKKLKEVGFPQPKIIDEGTAYEWNGGDYSMEDGFRFFDDEGIVHNAMYMDFDSEEDFFIPGLEQLIEACGDGFGELVRWKSDGWYAEKLNETQQERRKWCKTPKETVANLYIALNS